MAINNTIGIEVKKRLQDISDIKQESGESVKRSLEAKENADEAKYRSDITKKQLDEAIKNGDQVVEVQTLRVDPLTGESYTTAADRFEANQKELTSSIAKRTPYVTYEMFRQGNLTDSQIIDATHRYANDHRLPVLNLAGEYWLDQPLNTPIETSVNLGETIFHIDESKNNQNDYWFIVKASKSYLYINLSSVDKKSFLSKLGKENTISELKPYKNHLVFIIDENDLIGARYGEEFSTNKGQPKEDIFYVDEGGRVVGDLPWKFNDYTRLIAYPIEENFITIEGGRFYINGVRNPDVYYEYVKGIFSVRRSRTIFKNQWVGLEDGRDDMIYTTNSYVGFYDLFRVFDITLENIKALPRVQERENNVQPMGTYGIGGSQMMNVTLRNVTGVADDDRYWGFMGTNDVKNMTIEHCHLKNIDVHFNGRNLYVRDTYVGDRFTVSGGGDLYIENVKKQGNRFVIFRNDYGANWDGDIKIFNSKLIMHLSTSPVRVLNFNTYDFDFMNEITWGKTITIENFTIDYTQAPDNVSDSDLMLFPSFSEFSHGQRIHFPHHLEFKNIYVVGRERGVQLLDIPNPLNFKMKKKGSFDGYVLQPNCHIRFENVDTYAPIVTPYDQNVSVFMNVISDDVYKDEYSLYPFIEVINCGEVSYNLRSAICDLKVENCTVTMGDVFKRSAVTFENCLLKPNVTSIETKSAYRLSSDREQNTLINCMLDIPIVDGKEKTDPTIIDQLFNNIIVVNSRVRQIHMGTKLSRKYKNSFGTIWSETYEKLQSSNGYTATTAVLKKSGSFAQRPTDASVPIGWRYWNQDDNIMMIWDGSLWRSATGEIIPV